MSTNPSPGTVAEALLDARQDPGLVDAMAEALCCTMRHGIGRGTDWSAEPEHSKEAFRSGIRSALTSGAAHILRGAPAP
jgi:hypothetical protein